MYLGGRRLPKAMTLVAYYDDSFLTGGPVYTLGGYMGDLEMFDSILAPGWNRIIREAPHEISEFKTSDCRQRRGEFSDEHGWTQRERDELTKQLVEVIIDKIPEEQIYGYSSVVAFPGFWSDSDAQAMEHRGFLHCLIDVLQAIFCYARSWLGNSDSIEIVFDYKPKYVELSAKYFHEAMRIVGHEWAERFSFPIFLDSKKVAPLQAADLLAYETMKETRSRMLEPHRPVSKALDKLVSNRMHWARCMTYDQTVAVEGLKRLNLDPSLAGKQLAPMLLYSSGEPWRAPNHWPFRHGPRAKPTK